MLVGAGQVALQREVDEARVDGAELFPAAAEALHGAWSVILQHHIGAARQAMRDGAAIASGRLWR